MRRPPNGPGAASRAIPLRVRSWAFVGRMGNRGTHGMMWDDRRPHGSGRTSFLANQDVVHVRHKDSPKENSVIRAVLPARPGLVHAFVPAECPLLRT